MKKVFNANVGGNYIVKNVKGGVAIYDEYGDYVGFAKGQTESTISESNIDNFVKTILDDEDWD